MFCDAAGGDVDHGNLIFGGERDVGLLIIGEGDADGFVKASGAFFEVKVLNGCDDAEVGGAGGIGVDHADGVGNMIADPGFAAIGSDRDTHRVNANGDAL